MLHVPVCHLRRADLALRPEFAAVLRAAGVGGEDVLTLEDVVPREAAASIDQEVNQDGEDRSLRPEDTCWLLVDHNAMTGALARAFATRVVGCVDHHADEGVVPRDARIRVVEKSGSCTSLVLGRCADVWDALGADGTDADADDVVESAQIDAQLARLALGPILIDTSNLRDENKTTAHDERAVALAEGKIKAYADAMRDKAVGTERVVGLEKYDRDTFFGRISALKEDIAGMSFRDIFRKDYKEWSVGSLNLGTSSIPQGFRYLVDAKAGGDAAAFLSELENWGAEKDGDLREQKAAMTTEKQKMDLVVVLTTFMDHNDRFSRELLVWARTDKGVIAAKLFEKNNKEKLRLEFWGAGKLDADGRGGQANGLSGWRRCWQQGASRYSRKQIAPMLWDALNDVSGNA